MIVSTFRALPPTSTTLPSVVARHFSNGEMVYNVSQISSILDLLEMEELSLQRIAEMEEVPLKMVEECQNFGSWYDDYSMVLVRMSRRGLRTFVQSYSEVGVHEGF